MGRRKPQGNPMEATAEAGRSLAATDAAVFGTIGSSGREVIKEFLITKIRPDFRQPRRTIPLAVRGEWNGNPDVVGAILQRWVTMAGQELGEQIAVPILLNGMLDGSESYTITPDKFPIAHSLMELIALAANIMKDGLIYPITIVEHGKEWMINTGERRWLAHHLLSATVQADEYKKIKARVVEGNVWVQAAENGSRSPLNAISMARQLSLLIMDMYEGEETFDDYESMVQPGGCDQPYYAQVADLRIKRGYGQRVLDVTGLKSKNQVSQYRALLTIPDWLWDQADIQDWSENRIRETDQERRGVKKINNLDDEIDDGYTLTTVNVSTESDDVDETPHTTPTPHQMATPTGITPSIQPGQALGRDREKMLTVDRADEMADWLLKAIADNPTSYGYTDVAHTRKMVFGVLRSREILAETDDATPPPAADPETPERSIESETPIVAQHNVLKQILLNLEWAASNSGNGVLSKDINELSTLSLEILREWVSDFTIEDIQNEAGELNQLLSKRHNDIMAFINELLNNFWQDVSNEAVRMRVKHYENQ